MVSHGNGIGNGNGLGKVCWCWFELVWVRKVKRMDEMNETMMKHFACTSSLAH